MPDDKPDPWAEARRKGVYRPDAGTAAGVTGATKEKFGTTAGKGLGAKGKGAAGMPKMGEPGHEGEDAAAYAARMRKYREGQAKDPRSAAIRELAGRQEN